MWGCGVAVVDKMLDYAMSDISKVLGAIDILWVLQENTRILQGLISIRTAITYCNSSFQYDIFIISKLARDLKNITILRLISYII